MKHLVQDYNTYKLTPIKLIAGIFIGSTFFLIALYRLSNWFSNSNLHFVANVLINIERILYSCEIDASSEIGPGLRIVHSVGIVIGPRVIVGQNFRLHQNVTIGMRGRMNEEWITPRIGNNVTIYAGAAVLGRITIGDNVVIGANSVVIKNVPSNTIVAGVPAKVIKIIPNIPEY